MKHAWTKQSGWGSGGHASTSFRWLDVISSVIDDKLEVLIQQSIDERGAGHTLSICQAKKDILFSNFIAVIKFHLTPNENG